MSISATLVHRDFIPSQSHSSAALRKDQPSPINRDSFTVSTHFVDPKYRGTATHVPQKKPSTLNTLQKRKQLTYLQQQRKQSIPLNMKGSLPSRNLAAKSKAQGPALAPREQPYFSQVNFFKQGQSRSSRQQLPGMKLKPITNPASKESSLTRGEAQKSSVIREIEQRLEQTAQAKNGQLLSLRLRQGTNPSTNFMAKRNSASPIMNLQERSQTVQGAYRPQQQEFATAIVSDRKNTSNLVAQHSRITLKRKDSSKGQFAAGVSSGQAKLPTIKLTRRKDTSALTGRKSSEKSSPEQPFLMQQLSQDSLDQVDRKPSKLNAESMQNITSDAIMLSDRKRPEQQAFKTKIVRHYDFFTGRNVNVKLDVPVRMPQDKSIYQKLTERRPQGFGRTMGICVKSIEKTGSLKNILRNGKEQTVKEADESESTHSCARLLKWQERSSSLATTSIRQSGKQLVAWDRSLMSKSPLISKIESSLMLSQSRLKDASPRQNQQRLRKELQGFEEVLMKRFEQQLNQDSSEEESTRSRVPSFGEDPAMMASEMREEESSAMLQDVQSQIESVVKRQKRGLDKKSQVAALATPKTAKLSVQKKGSSRYLEDSESILPVPANQKTSEQRVQKLLSTQQSLSRPESKRRSRRPSREYFNNQRPSAAQQTQRRTNNTHAAAADGANHTKSFHERQPVLLINTREGSDHYEQRELQALEQMTKTSNTPIQFYEINTQRDEHHFNSAEALAERGTNSRPTETHSERMTAQASTAGAQKPALDQNHQTNPAIIQASKMHSQRLTQDSFHATNRTELTAHHSVITTDKTIYKEPVHQLAQIQKKAIMQLFGGRTGGSQVRTAMRNLGLSLSKQKQLEASLRKRNEESVQQRSNASSLTSQQRIVMKLASRQSSAYGSKDGGLAVRTFSQSRQS